MTKQYRFPVTIWLALCCLIVFAVALHTADVEKQTFIVTMRDGTPLATDVYLPANTGSFPVLLIRTPYNKDGAASLAKQTSAGGYVVVVQDTRGRFASKGENLPFAGDGWWDGHADGYDTLEWVSKQAWCNGKVGTWGGSALGITQLGLAGTGTNKLAFQHITVAAPSMYHHGVFPGGIFKKAMIEDWLRTTNHSPDALRYWTSHSTYDAFWRERDLSLRWNKVNVPAVHIGGWFDIFAQGTIDAFVGYQTKGGPRARGKQKLVMGPWTHGVLQKKAGELTFPDADRPPYRTHDLRYWMEYYLKGQDNGLEREPAIVYYVMGDVDDPAAPGNEWRTANAWPPVKTIPTPLYLYPDHSLQTRKPTAGKTLEYEYAPRNPVPTVGGYQLTLPSGPMDQRKIEDRADVLVFTSQPLAEPMEVTGQPVAHVWVASDAPDTDFFVRLCDVYPDGRSYNICEGMLRARFRESFSREKRMVPGQVYELKIPLWSTSIIFNRGHRIRVHITSSSAPGYDPNPNTGEPFRASSNMHAAKNVIYMDGAHPTRIVLPVAGRVAFQK